MSDVTLFAIGRGSIKALQEPDSLTYLTSAMLSASAATTQHARLRSAQL